MGFAELAGAATRIPGAAAGIRREGTENLKGEPARVGRHGGGNADAVTPEVVAFYADALGDPSELYRKLAPPLLYHSECYRFVLEGYLKNPFGKLHARQGWELFAPIGIGTRVRTRSTIVDRYHKRGRDYIVNETGLDEDDGTRILAGSASALRPPA